MFHGTLEIISTFTIQSYQAPFLLVTISVYRGEKEIFLNKKVMKLSLDAAPEGKSATLKGKLC